MSSLSAACAEQREPDPEQAGLKVEFSGGQAAGVRVVRHRRALVYARPVSGATVIAEVLARQALMPVFEAGKWVEVEYFDSGTNKTRQGWLLKKYTSHVFRKIPTNKGGDAMRRYRQDLSIAIVESEADIKAGRYTVETPDEHMRWLASVL